MFFSRKAFDHLLHCREMLPGLCLAVEFRHKSWFQQERREQTLRFEREHGFTHVVVDEPQGFANSIPAVWEATTSQAYVRFHGRNAQTWNVKGLASSADRFNYRYSRSELEALAAQVSGLAAQVSRVHALFNTNYGDQGVVNAQGLLALLPGGVM